MQRSTNRKHSEQSLNDSNFARCLTLERQSSLRWVKHVKCACVSFILAPMKNGHGWTTPTTKNTTNHGGDGTIVQIGRFVWFRAPIHRRIKSRNKQSECAHMPTRRRFASSKGPWFWHAKFANSECCHCIEWAWSGRTTVGAEGPHSIPSWWHTLTSRRWTASESGCQLLMARMFTIMLYCHP